MSNEKVNWLDKEVQVAHAYCWNPSIWSPWTRSRFELFIGVCWLTSSYMNCRVRADFPTPPLPTIITLCSARELWFLLLLVAITGFFFVPLSHTPTHTHTLTHSHPHTHTLTHTPLCTQTLLTQPANDKSGNISVYAVNNLHTGSVRTDGSCYLTAFAVTVTCCAKALGFAPTNLES